MIENSQKYIICLFFLICLVFSFHASSKSDLSLSHLYFSALKSDKIYNNKQKAQELLDEVIKSIELSSPLLKNISKTFNRYNPKDQENTTVAGILKFHTGSYSQYFCKSKGLVHFKGVHNDKTKSEVILVQSQKEIQTNSYSNLSDGSWRYIYIRTDSKGNQTLIKADYKIKRGQKKFDIRETDNLGNQALYSIQNLWAIGHKHRVSDEENYNQIFFIRKSPKETYSLNMPFKLAHGWGSYNHELTFRIKFYHESKEVFQSSTEIMLSNQPIKINYDVVRKVTKYFDNYEFNYDSKVFTYEDCWQVTSQVKASYGNK